MRDVENLGVPHSWRHSENFAANSQPSQEDGELGRQPPPQALHLLNVASYDDGNHGHNTFTAKPRA